MTTSRPTSTCGPERVAIVGCGFTGTSALYQLVHGYPIREIVIFEKSGRFGPGYPYQAADCADYLMNSPADALGAAPWDRSAFHQWLLEHPAFGAVAGNSYRSRRDFGLYLEDVVQKSLAHARRLGIRVNTVASEVTAVREIDSGVVEIEWVDGSCRTDAVILATGRCPDIHPSGLPSARLGSQYFPTHILCDELTQIPMDATCHVLGASLSAYDVINRLFSRDTGCRFIESSNGVAFDPGPNRRRVVLCSRSGRLKKVGSSQLTSMQRMRLTRETFESMQLDGKLTLDSIADLLREEAALQGATIDWPEVFDPYSGCDSTMAINRRAATLLEADIDRARCGGTANFLVDLAEEAKPFLWEIFAEHWLPAAEERRYRVSVETALLAYSAPCPIPTAERVLALMRAGRIEVRHGTNAVSLNADGSTYRIKHSFGEDIATVLINTTGLVDRRVNSLKQSPLTTSMRDQGKYQAYSVGGVESDGVSVDMTSFRATGSRAIYVANMFLWGPGFFTSSAYRMASVVNQILLGLYRE